MTTKRPHRLRRRAPAELDAAAAELVRLAADRQLIAGIYNYCDGWCERCPHTARCLVFKTEQARHRKRSERAGDRDLVNQDFWEDLGESLALALHMVRRDAKKLGVDLDAPDALAALEIEERRRRRQSAREGSALHRAAGGYWRAAKALLDRLPEELRATEAALNTQARLGLADPQTTAADIRDALEVVRWYLFFIDVKLQRAVSSRVAERAEKLDGFPSDADATAKVALVAIDRSLAAWARLRGHLTGEADAILDLLVRLERLRRAVEAEFPAARAFRRPGLD
jgi:hypothetical protein